MPAFNLIPSHRCLAQCRLARIHRWLAAGAAWCVLLAAAYLWCHAAYSGSAPQLARDLGAQDQQVYDGEQAIGRLQPLLTEARLALEASRAVANQPDWSVLLALLAREKGEEVVLRACLLEPLRVDVPLPVGAGPDAAPGPDRANATRFVMRVSGLGRTQLAVQSFVLRLEASGLFHRVKMVDTRMEPFLAGEAFSFRIECHLVATREAHP